MKFFRSSVKYSAKNLWLLLLITLPATVFFSLLLKFSPLVFLRNYKNIQINSFMSIQNSIFDFSYQTIVFSAVLFVLIVLGVCLAFSLIEFHMRTGKLSIKGALAQFKNYLAPTFFVCFLFCVLYFVFVYLFGAIVYFAQAISGRIGQTMNYRLFIVAVLVYLSLVLCFVWIATLFVLALISKVLNRYRFKEALSYTSIHYEGNFAKLVWTFYGVAILASLVLLFADGFLCSWVIRAVALGVLFAFVIVSIMVAHFSRNNIERKDEVKGYF